ncbi:MAG: histidine--tRNA ligase [Syntrophomonadaceae bacterium]|jgi:histidyl-tRNA synthetase|nr:histidine--tRNA ligase [Syntrophomonadaceae bacterium]
MDISGPRGTHDILPDEIKIWHKMEQVLRKTAEIYGYSEIRTPIFEYTELFERGVGGTTDIVQKEMYTFEDKAGRSLTLRPEGTASCARAFIQHRMYNQPQPTKMYYIGPMFRYDRPQSGRYRQFHQFGVEVFGTRSPAVDAEVITLMVDIVKRLGLRRYELHLNTVGCGNCRPHYRQTLTEFLRPLQADLCRDCQSRVDSNPLRVLDCKEKRCREILAGFPSILDSICEECREHFERVKSVLDLYGVQYILDERLVRGLDYYTNTAFELLVPGLGAQNAVGGGGRYDNLVAQVGGPDTVGIGFAMGMERLLLALEENQVELVDGEGVEVYVAFNSPELEPLANIALNELRSADIKAERDYGDRSLRAQMKQANRSQAVVTVLIGENEAKSGTYSLRDMDTGEQFEIEQNALIAEIKKILMK